MEKEKATPVVLPVSWITKAAEGDNEAFASLSRRLAPLIRSQIQRFSFIEADEEDLQQECLVALMSAVRHYRTDANASFTTYFTACVRNRLLSFNRHLQSSSVQEQALENEDTLTDAEGSDPMEKVLEREDASRLRKTLRERLTPLEYAVLRERLKDRSYDQTAKRLGVSKKAVDNAVQRLRRKLTDL